MRSSYIPIVMAIFLVCLVSGCEKELGVREVVPPNGVLSGGEPVDILVSGFAPGMGVTVYFGNSKAENVVVSGTDKLTISTPSAQEPKTVDVRIILDSGQEFVIKDGFRYFAKGSLDIRDLGRRKSMRDKQQ